MKLRLQNYAVVIEIDNSYVKYMALHKRTELYMK
jgi:hypothetical protein